MLLQISLLQRLSFHSYPYGKPYLLLVDNPDDSHYHKEGGVRLAHSPFSCGSINAFYLHRQVPYTLLTALYRRCKQFYIAYQIVAMDINVK